MHEGARRPRAVSDRKREQGPGRDSKTCASPHGDAHERELTDLQSML
jgi:hypothetical protein